MRYLLSLPVIGLAAVLSACGHSTASTTDIVPLTYSIGGSIAGLSGTVVLQDNGSDNLSLSRNGSFSFNVTLQPNSAYAVTVATQPANQVCTVANGNGTAAASVTSVAVTCTLNSAASDIWTWVGGSDYVDAIGVYGTQGTAAAGNTPGARRQPISWTDAAGNFWLFGGNGVGNVGMLNDLWEYSPTAELWTWQGGAQTLGTAATYGTQGTAAAANNPGAREGAAKWTDAAGNLWLFGGDSLAGQNWEDFNDLWEFSMSTMQWIWVGGSSVAGSTSNTGSYGTVGVAAAGNLPPPRTDSISWVDSAGLFWLFGGTQLDSRGGYVAVFNDLWNYNPTTGQWTWVGGSSNPNGASVFGTQGTAAPGNLPAAREGASSWLDASGNLWLFGGLGLAQSGAAQEYNDLWEYNPAAAEWTWVGGSNAPNSAGAYGTPHAAAAGNGPGARVSAVSWTDLSGNFWLFGGYGYAQAGYLGYLNDLWEYNLVTGQWSWIDGASAAAADGSYGTQGVPASGNIPGAREQAVGWVDTSGNFWLFGGFGFDSFDVNADLNDLWRFTQSP